MKKLKSWLKNNKKKVIKLCAVLCILIPVITFVSSKYIIKKAEKVSYNEFVTMAKNKEISKAKIELEGSVFNFYGTDGKKYVTDNPRDESFKKTLLEYDISVEEHSAINLKNILNLIIKLMLMGFVATMFYNVSNGPLNKANTPISKVPSIHFSDVAGSKEIIEDIRVIVDFLKDSKKYTKSGAKMPKGVIFYGEPGTGKTLTAKAIAGEANVPFYSMAGSDFVELYVGLGAKRVRDLFDKARKNAPCIIYIDEIDALAKQRTINSHSEQDQTLNALLAEIDGFKGSEGIMLIASTNRLDVLDPAVLRPGRFDKHIRIELPDQPSRLEILNYHSGNKKIDENVSLAELSKQTIGFSGADLEALVNEATIISVAQGKETVDSECFDKAYFQKVLNGYQKSNPLRDYKEEQLVAYHEAGHALMAKLTNAYEVPKVTIIPNTSGTGGVTLTVPKKMGLFTKKELINQVMVNYAGRASEQILLGTEDAVTTGCYSDIEKATKLIQRIITSFGMTKDSAYLNLNTLNIESEYILEGAKSLSNEIYDETLNILRKNEDSLKAIAGELLSKETLKSDELDSIMSNFSKNADI